MKNTFFWLNKKKNKEEKETSKIISLITQFS